MAERSTSRQILVLVPWPALREAYEAGNRQRVEDEIAERLTRFNGPAFDAKPFRVLALPSNRVRPSGLDVPRKPAYQRLVVTLGLGERTPIDMRIRLIRALHNAVRAGAFGKEAQASVGADLPIDPAEHWCPGEASHPLFGDRAAALRTLRADNLPALDLPGNNRVNLVFVDTGIPDRMLPPVGQLRGWEVDPDEPGTGEPARLPGAPLTGHGEMVATNAHAIASGATVLDCPLIPDGIKNLPLFLDAAVAAYIGMLETIETDGEPGEAWVLSNAWGVFDPSTEAPPGSYTRDPLHPLALELARADAMGVDVVFAAGNCGQFCPNPRCGADHTGPGLSMHGANAHPDVLTVGAVRNDALWLGFSAQGPGPIALGYAKPDLCAPSQFADGGNANAPNTGTSAACGLAAGAVAVLRTRWDPQQVPPAALRGFMAASAWQPSGAAGWNARFGFGILDLTATASTLPSLPPSA